MTGWELARARELLGVSPASLAAQLGYNSSSASAVFSADDVARGESNGGTLADAALNAAAERSLRPFLSSRGIR